MLFGKTAQRICRRLTTTLTVSLVAGDGLGMMQKVRCIAKILRWIRFQFNGDPNTTGDMLGYQTTTEDMLRCGWRCFPNDFVLKILRWIRFQLTDPLTADGRTTFAGRTTPSIKYGGTREIPTLAAPPSLLGGTAPG